MKFSDFRFFNGFIVLESVEKDLTVLGNSVSLCLSRCDTNFVGDMLEGLLHGELIRFWCKSLKKCCCYAIALTIFTIYIP